MRRYWRVMYKQFLEAIVVGKVVAYNQKNGHNRYLQKEMKL